MNIEKILAKNVFYHGSPNGDMVSLDFDPKRRYGHSNDVPIIFITPSTKRAYTYAVMHKGKKVNFNEGFIYVVQLVDNDPSKYFNMTSSRDMKNLFKEDKDLYEAMFDYFQNEKKVGQFTGDNLFSEEELENEKKRFERTVWLSCNGFATEIEETPILDYLSANYEGAIYSEDIWAIFHKENCKIIKQMTSKQLRNKQGHSWGEGFWAPQEEHEKYSGQNVFSWNND